MVRALRVFLVLGPKAGGLYPCRARIWPQVTVLTICLRGTLFPSLSQRFQKQAASGPVDGGQASVC